MKIKNLLYGFVVVCFFSCSESNQSKRYDIQEIRNSKDEYVFDNLQYSLIPLELNKDYPVGEIIKICVSDDYMIIAGSTYVYKYSKNGAFLNMIGSVGKGPNDYGFILDVSLDESENRLYICDNMTQKVLEYDMNTDTFTASHTYNPFWWRFEATRDLFLVNTLNLMGNDPYKFMTTSHDGDSLTKYPNHIVFEMEDLFLLPDVKTFQKYHDDYIFRQRFNDTIYTFSPEQNALSMRYFFDFGTKRLPLSLLANSERFDKESIHYGYIYDLSETKNHIFLAIIYHGKTEKYLIDKTSNQSYTLSDGIPFNKKGLKFWPKWIYKNQMVDFIGTEYLLENIDKIDDQKLKSELMNATVEQNPLIIIAHSD